MNTQYQDQNNDSIIRSWLLAQLDGLGDTRLIKRNFVALVTNAQTVDAVPVVRCLECKYLMFSDCYGECSKGYLGIVRPDDFCSIGERKEGADRLEETND